VAPYLFLQLFGTSWVQGVAGQKVVFGQHLGGKLAGTWAREQSLKVHY